MYGSIVGAVRIDSMYLTCSACVCVRGYWVASSAAECDDDEEERRNSKECDRPEKETLRYIVVSE
jgi:hypothetical protein